MACQSSVRWIALGGLAVAIGCRSSHPGPIGHARLHQATAVPVATSPTVYNGPYGMVHPSSPTVGEVKPGSVSGVVSSPDVTVLPDIADGPALPVIPPTDVAALLMKASKPREPDLLPMPAPAHLPGPDPVAELPAKPDAVFVAAPKALAPFIPIVVPAKPLASPMKSGETIGHAPDFRWVAGVLDRHRKGGYWTLRYADLSVDDRWGGKVRLMDDARLTDLQDGDTVFVEGELLAPASDSAAAGTTSYPPFRVTSVKVSGR